MKRSNARHRGRLAAIIVTAAAIGLGVGIATALADDDQQPVDFTHNVLDAPAPVTQAIFGTGTPRIV